MAYAIATVLTSSLEFSKVLQQSNHLRLVYKAKVYARPLVQH